MDRGFGTAGDDDVGLARRENVIGVTEALGRRGAGGDQGLHTGAGLEFHADGSRRAIGHEHGNGQRHDPARAFLLERVPGVEQSPDSADSGGPGDGCPFRVGLLEACVGHGFTSGDESELARGVEAFGLDPLEVVGHDLWVDLGCEVHGEAVFLRPVVVHRVDAGLTCQNGFPSGIDSRAQGGYRTDSGDDNFRCHGTNLVDSVDTARLWTGRVRLLWLRLPELC